MATKARVDSEGRIRAVYDDVMRPFLENLGKLEIVRATDVEFDNQTQEWFAVYRPTGQEIARGKDRDKVISLEVEWLEKNVIV